MTTCEHRNNHFDRSMCACGAMHTYCDDCGLVLDSCPYEQTDPQSVAKSENVRRWDVAFSRRSSTSETQQAVIPAPIGRALSAAGYDRAILTITASGLLFSPYKSSSEKPKHPSSHEIVDLPDWKTP